MPPSRPAIDPLPKTVHDWHELVQKHGVGANTLGRISAARSFSGSTIHTAAFLQLRALWPGADDTSKAVNVLQKAGLFGSEDLDLARNLIEDMTRQDDALKLFTKEIANHAATSQTPISRSAGADRRALGWFGPSMVHWRRLTSQRYTKCVIPQHQTGRPAVGPAVAVPKLDLRKQAAPQTHGSEEDGDTDMDDDLAEINEVMRGLELGFETPSKAPKISGKTTDQSRPGAFKPPFAPATRTVPEADRGRDKDHSEAPPTYDRSRTGYEVRTTIFFITYVTSLLAWVIGMELDAHVIVAAEERRYTFGQKTDPPAGGGAGAFNAAPDGAFYYRDQDTGRLKPFVFFEMKPFDWDVSHAKNLAICYEVTAEMAAFLYEQFYPRPRPSKARGPDDESNRAHHRVVVSQNHRSFWITHVYFRDSYLDYITDADQAASPAPGGGPTARDMITFQRFGPFQFVIYKDVKQFNLIITAIVLAQLRATDGGDALLRRCEASVAGHKAVPVATEAAS